jgi:hypothetical protein
MYSSYGFDASVRLLQRLHKRRVLGFSGLQIEHAANQLKAGFDAMVDFLHQHFLLLQSRS